MTRPPTRSAVPRRSWSGTVRFQARDFARPGTEAEVVALVRDAARRGRPVKVVGAGHSFSDIADTTGTLVSIDALSGIRRIDPDSGEVSIGAGTRLHALNRLLAAEGLALANLGDIDRQSIAGAVSTGTHGTGLAFTGLAALVTGLRIVLANGEIADCAADRNPEVFEAARLGLGALGVITELTIRCVPSYWLRAIEQPAPLATTLDGFVDECRAADHFEFFWFPHTERVLTKRLERLPHPAGPPAPGRLRALLDDEIVANGLFALACRLGKRAPAMTPRINRLADRLVATRSYTDRSFAVFASPRRVRFREMEYAVPIEQTGAAVREVRDLIERRGWRVSFPIEVRSGAADEVWLSPAYRRDTGYIAVHRYVADEHRDYFDGVEALLTARGGRPHWGKMHTQTHDYLARQYPRMADLQRVRDEVDPHRVFGNAYLHRVLGP